MSRRWGISIPRSSFPNEICLIDSGIVHPRTGEKTATPPHASRKSRAAGLAWYCRIEKVRRSIAFTDAWAEGRWRVASSGWRVIRTLPRLRRGNPFGSSLDTRHSSLHLNRSALLLELGLDSGRFVLGYTRLHRLWRAVDHVLRFLEAETGQLAHDLDDLDFLRTGLLEDDVELRLLLHGRSRGTAATTRSRGCTAHWGGGDRHVEARLECLDQIMKLEHAHVPDRFENLVLAQRRWHRGFSPRNPRQSWGVKSGSLPGDYAAEPPRCWCSASSAPANMYNIPLSAPTKAAIGDCSPAPSWASICSRDGIEANCFT